MLYPPKKLRLYLLPSCLFVFYFFIGFILPYMHDDWAWGSQIGLDRLATSFVNYNGRWAGNLLVLAITRSVLLRAFVYAISFTSIAVFGARLAGGGQGAFALFALLLLAIPRGQAASVVAWTSGFANYAASMALVTPLLCYIWQLLSPKKDAPQSDNFPRCAIAALGIFAASLFIEHVTLMLLGLLLLCLARHLMLHKKPALPLLLLLAAVIGAAVLMFTNGAYSVEAITDPNHYQKVALNSPGTMLGAAARQYMQSVAPLLLLSNTPLALLLGCGAGMVALMKSRRAKKRARFAFLACAFVLFAGAAYALFRDELPTPGNDKRSLSAVTFAFFIALAGVLLLCGSLRKRGAFLLAAGLGMTAPLLLASPIGHRNFFAIHIVWIVLATFLYCYIGQQIRARISLRHAELLLRWARSAAIFGIAFAASCYIFVYGSLALAARRQIDRVHSEIAAGASVVQLEQLPFNEWAWNAYPANDLFAERFKLFYKIPENIEIRY
ncbi:MAG: hypothetical protein LBC83_08490 [Oscillospiraceae bacterium]|nr:hypothetical protein [Oscillospiraceae bacterium]